LEGAILKIKDYVWAIPDRDRCIMVDAPKRMGRLIGIDPTDRYEWIVSFGPRHDPPAGPQCYDEDDLILVLPLELGDKIEVRYRDNGFVPAEIIGIDTDPGGRDGYIPWRCYTARLKSGVFLQVHTHGEGLSWRRETTPEWARDLLGTE
jgi:hypothetical protein